MPVKRYSRFLPTPSSFLVIVLLAVAANPANAQNLPDTEPPIIEIEALGESVADNTQVFAAQIAEDRVLLDAILYFRRQGQAAFTGAEMSPIGDTGYYSVSIDTDPNDLRTIEYYLQARDQSGNRTVSGFAFDPFQRQLLPASSRIVQNGISNDPVSSVADNSPEPFTPIYKRSWVQIAVGVLALGVLASAAGGGGGSSDDDTQSIRLNVPEPNL